MSDTDEMVRLMRHAADMLDHARQALAQLRTLNATEETAAIASIAAAANGSATLRMVAASVTPAAGELSATLDEMVADGYESWAEANQQMTMTPSELSAVADYLRWRALGVGR